MIHFVTVLCPNGHQVFGLAFTQEFTAAEAERETLQVMRDAGVNLHCPFCPELGDRFEFRHEPTEYRNLEDASPEIIRRNQAQIAERQRLEKERPASGARGG